MARNSSIMITSVSHTVQPFSAADGRLQSGAALIVVEIDYPKYNFRFAAFDLYRSGSYA